MSDNPTYEEQVDALVASVNAEPDPVNPENQQPSGQPEKVLGKYPTKDEATKGLHELARSLKSETSQRMKLEQEVAQLRGQLSQQSPAQTMSQEDTDMLDSVMEELAIEDKGKFKRAIDSRVSRIAEEKLKPVLSAISGAMELAQADQEMLNEFGEQYYRDLPGLRTFLTENPSVKEVADLAETRGQRFLARKYAYAEYRAHLKEKGEAQAQQGVQERKEANEQAKADGGLIGSSQKQQMGLAKPKAPRLTREKAAQIIQGVRKGDWKAFDDQFVTPLLPSEEALERMTGWSSLSRRR